MPQLINSDSSVQNAIEKMNNFYLTKAQNEKIAMDKIQEELQQKFKEETMMDTLNKNLLSNMKGSLEKEEKMISTMWDLLKKPAIEVEDVKFKKLSRLFISLHEKNKQMLLDTTKNIADENQRRFTELINFQNVNRQYLEEIINNLKVDYNNLTNKPYLLSKNEVINIVTDFQKKYEDLLNSSSVLKDSEIKKLINNYILDGEKAINSIVKSVNEKIDKLQGNYDWLIQEHEEIGEKIENLEKTDKDIYEKIKELKLTPRGNGGYFGAENLTVSSKSLKVRVHSITSDYPASTFDYLILGNATSGNITVTLPPATNTGLIITIKKTDSSSNTVTIQRGASDTIEGQTSATLSRQYTGYSFIADGATTWYVTSIS